MNDKQYDPPFEFSFLDAIFIAAVVAMYSKTADVMTFYTPQIVYDTLGDVGRYFGAFNAVLLEGTLGVLHFHPVANKIRKAIVVQIILFVMSGLYQVFDGMVVQKTLTSLTPDVRNFFQSFIPLTPLLIVGMLLWIGKLPKEVQPHKPWKGFIHAWNQIPKIWYGDNYVPTPKVNITNTPMNANAANTNAPTIATTVSKNGAGSNTPNP